MEEGLVISISGASGLYYASLITTLVNKILPIFRLNAIGSAIFVTSLIFFVFELVKVNFRISLIRMEKYIWTAILYLMVGPTIGEMHYEIDLSDKIDYEFASSLVGEGVEKGRKSFIPENAYLYVDKDNNNNKYVKVFMLMENVPFGVAFLSILFDGVGQHMTVFWKALMHEGLFNDQVKNSSGYFMAFDDLTFSGIKDPAIKIKYSKLGGVLSKLYELYLEKVGLHSERLPAVAFSKAIVFYLNGIEPRDNKLIDKIDTQAISDILSKYVVAVVNSPEYNINLVPKEEAVMPAYKESYTLQSYLTNLNNEFYIYVTKNLQSQVRTKIEEELLQSLDQNPGDRDKQVETLLTLIPLIPSVEGTVGSLAEKTSLAEKLSYVKSIKENYYRTKMNYILMKTLFPTLIRAMIILIIFSWIIMIFFALIPFTGLLFKKTFRFVIILFVSYLLYGFFDAMIDLILNLQFTRSILLRLADINASIDFETLYSYTNGYLLVFMILFLGVVTLVLNFGGALGQRLGSFVGGLGKNISPEFVTTGNISFGNLSVANFQLFGYSKDNVSRGAKSIYGVNMYEADGLAEYLASNDPEATKALMKQGYLKADKAGKYHFTYEGLKKMAENRYASTLRGATSGANKELAYANAIEQLIYESSKNGDVIKNEARRMVGLPYYEQSSGNQRNTATGSSSEQSKIPR